MTVVSKYLRCRKVLVIAVLSLAFLACFVPVASIYPIYGGDTDFERKSVLGELFNVTVSAAAVSRTSRPLVVHKPISLEVNGRPVLLHEGTNTKTLERLDSKTGYLLAADPSCNSDRHSNRNDEQCGNEVLDAARNPHAPSIRPSSPLRKPLAASERDRVGRYFGMCASRDPACPVEWISFISTCTAGGNRFIKSVTEKGFPVTVLGLGTVWRSRWGQRIRILHDYLTHVPDERIIVWSDADDVVVAPHTTIDSLVEVYRDMVRRRGGPTIFFPAEVACYPDGKLWRNYTRAENIPNGQGPSPFTYLNAGVMVGPASHIRALIRTIYKEDCSDDQRSFTHAILDPIIWWPDGAGFQVSSSRQDMRVGATRIPRVGSASQGDGKSSQAAPAAKAGAAAGTAEPEYDLVEDFPPPGAVPLIGLDYWNSMIAAMYGQYAKNVTYSSKGVTIPATKGSPLIIHQNGDKRHNKILEILARAFGLEYDQAAIDFAKKTKQI
nr:Multifunctional procollagen lysine hydroxylase and glycosyltransferase LH3 [Polyrhizophydium stewartii]